MLVSSKHYIYNVSVKKRWGGGDKESVWVKNIGAKALEASASAIGSRVGNITIDKIEKKFSKPTEASKPKP